MNKFLTSIVTTIILLSYITGLMSIISTIDTSIPISTCMNIDSPGYYYLTIDLSGVQDIYNYCIGIYADDVVLDGRGYSVIGNYSGYGIYVHERRSVVIENINIIGYYGGVDVYNSSNITIENVIVNSSKLFGIHLSQSNSNIIRKVTVSYSDNYGVFLEKSSSNIIDDVIASNNSESGLKIIESNNNFITNILVTNIVGWGVHIAYSNSNIVLNATVTNSEGSGVALVESSNNTIANSTLSNNRYGVFLRDSIGNIIVNNTVISNELGVSIYNSSNNLIYNNYFKNTRNILIEISKHNTWNIAKIKGENIIGGGYLGGNYWGSLDERGFSDTCSDRDNDGICDESFVIDENNIDQYPLKPIQQISTTTPIQTPTLTPLPVSTIVIGAILAMLIIIILIAIRKIRR